jgi:hypothetical protein
MTEQRGRGRSRFEPTEQQRRTVKAMSAYGIPHRDISVAIEISEPTLRQYFWRELETGTAEANAKVAESLFQKAIGTSAQSVTAAIFWLKCRAGWIDQPQLGVGKKEAAQRAAEHAGKHSGWGNDLEMPGTWTN